MREIRTSSSMRAWRKRTVGTTRRDRHRESGSSQQAPSNPSGTAPPRRLYIPVSALLCSGPHLLPTRRTRAPPPISSILTVLALLSISATPFAQEYPSKPIRMIVPLVPGGGTHVAARVTGQKLTGRWARQGIVDNRPGAGGNIGAEIVTSAAPDGYTLLVTNPGPIVVNPWLFSKLPFDPAKDLTPVVMLAPTYYVLITHTSVPANSVRELVQVAQKQPGKLVLASGGVGAPSDLMGEM